MSISNTEEIVSKTRKYFEIGSVDQDLLIEMYRNYTDVGDTAGFVSTAKTVFPNGNCGLASLYLKRELGGEIVQGKYGENKHTFLVVDDTVIDITADQFGGPKVYVGPLRSPWGLKGEKVD